MLAPWSNNDWLWSPPIARSLGLLPWQNRLVAWCLYTSGTGHYVQMLVGDRFIDFCPTSATLDTYSAIYPVGGDMVLVAQDGEGGQGFYYTYGKQDGYITTSWLDMGQPGRLKRLHALHALLDDSAQDFYVDLYYRTDESQAWTQASSQDGVIRATAADLDIEFYLLQVKVALDDDTGDDEDIAIEKIAVTYSVDFG